MHTGAKRKRESNFERSEYTKKLKCLNTVYPQVSGHTHHLLLRSSHGRSIIQNVKFVAGMQLSFEDFVKAAFDK